MIYAPTVHNEAAPPKHVRGGFTLFEMLASLAIIGLFMTLLSFHLVSLSSIWLSSNEDEFFDQHVDGVQLFLSSALEQSEGLESNALEGSATGQTTASADASLSPVRWSRPPHWSNLDDPLLGFSQTEAPALFVREGQHLPAIRAWLYFDEREGLSILWHSELEAEPPERVEDLYLTPVSRFITRMEYAYYDLENDRWEIESRPETTGDGTHILPQFLRFTFEYQGESKQRMVYIPQAVTHVPLF
ncbi:MAG: prepilin-type N-terminal cleavage/methylation domain-containing protein [Opitutales bacterium]|nr:prepilin-type N-terminal cleavage/methylation domain-containing protein [Opitutales bacterium]